MNAPFKKNFEKKIEDLNKLLHKDLITIVMDYEALHEYNVRCDVLYRAEKAGTILLYYSPKKNSFKADVRKVKLIDVQEKISKYFDQEKVEKAYSETKQSEKKISGLKAYVDGSFLDNRVAYGAVVLLEEQMLIEFSGIVSDPNYQHARQVAGELMAVGKVIQWCVANSVTEVSIFYDYEGIEHWVTGKWKAKQILTQRYRDFVVKSNVKINWIKVAAHTGVYWNEYVDSLAKNAIKSM